MARSVFRTVPPGRLVSTCIAKLMCISRTVAIPISIPLSMPISISISAVYLPLYLGLYLYLYWHNTRQSFSFRDYPSALRFPTWPWP